MLLPRKRRVVPVEEDIFITGPGLHDRIVRKLTTLERMQDGDSRINIFEYLNFGHSKARNTNGTLIERVHAHHEATSRTNSNPKLLQAIAHDQCAKIRAYDHCTPNHM